MTRLTRRELLQLGAATALAGVAGCERDEPDAEPPTPPLSHPLIDQLRADFDYLTFDEDGLRRYLADVERHWGRFETHHRVDDRIRHQFLMSTDFFQKGADETRTVGYAAFYDPYLTPCYNPLR